MRFVPLAGWLHGTMRKSPLDLGKRERQIVEAVYRLGEASVSEVLSELTDPPGYSSIRAMLGQLVGKARSQISAGRKAISLSSGYSQGKGQPVGDAQLSNNVLCW